MHGDSVKTITRRVQRIKLDKENLLRNDEGLIIVIWKGEEKRVNNFEVECDAYDSSWNETTKEWDNQFEGTKGVIENNILEWSKGEDDIRTHYRTIYDFMIP